MLIDRDAAGYGWFVAPTPFDDSEFPITVGQSELDSGTGTMSLGRNLTSSPDAIFHRIAM